MKKIILLILSFGLISLSGFDKESVDYEQITFNYFIADILKSDFKDITAIEFKGTTENTFSTLGAYQFCLKPEEKLQSSIKEVTKGSTSNPKTIRHEQFKNVSFSDFQNNSNTPKLFIYPTVRVADNFYVFVSLQMPDNEFVKYVFELRPDGNIARSCKMENEG